MEQLFIRLLHHKDDEMYAEWALYSLRQKMFASERPLPVRECASHIPSFANKNRQVIVLVPGQDILLTSVTVTPKQRRHLQEILPFLVEEQLAENIAQLHIAAAAFYDESEALPVMVVKKERMQRWLTTLEEAGIAADIMLPETATLSYASEHWFMLSDGQRAWVCVSDKECYTVEYSMIADLLRLLSEKYAEETILMQCQLCGGDDNARIKQQLMQIQSAIPRCTLQFTTASSVLDVFSAAYLQLPRPISQNNLLQGEFNTRSTGLLSPQLWQSLMYIAGLWFAGLMLIDGLQLAYFGYRADALQQEEVALYRQLYPSDTKIIDPRKQMESHIRVASSSEQTGFLSLLQKLAGGWPADEAPAQMHSLSYHEDEGSLTLEISASSIELVNTLIQKLGTSGLAAKLQYVANKTDGVTAQLSVRSAE